MTTEQIVKEALLKQKANRVKVYKKDVDDFLDNIFLANKFIHKSYCKIAHCMCYKKGIKIQLAKAIDKERSRIVKRIRAYYKECIEKNISSSAAFENLVFDELEELNYFLEYNYG